MPTVNEPSPSEKATKKQDTRETTRGKHARGKDSPLDQRYLTIAVNNPVPCAPRPQILLCLLRTTFKISESSSAVTYVLHYIFLINLINIS